MFQTDRTVQPSLFAFSHRDLVSGDSDVWLYMDLFSVLDLSDFEAAYEFQGQAAKEPQLMLQVLFYGLTHGIVSGRKLQAFCRNDNRFIVLSGNLRPDRRTFDRFIKRHNDRFKKLFVQVVRLSQRMGLVSLGRIAIDGSKFKGAADKAMAYGSMDRAIVHIEDNLVKLKQELAQANSEEATDLEDKLSNELVRQEVRRHRIAAAKAAIDEDFARRKKKRPESIKLRAKKALIDPEALSLPNKRRFMFGYNAQAAVDEKSQIVVACDLHDRATNYGALPALVDQVEANCGSHANAYLADAGYQSLDNLKKVCAVGATPVICRKASKAEEFSEQITKGSHDREYLCKAGRKLPLASRKSTGYLAFKLAKNFCDGCQAPCMAYGKKHPEVLDDADRQWFNDYLAYSRSAEWKKAYKQRKAIVEPVFGNIRNKGIKIFVRGRKAVSAWWNITTTAHNIEKVIKHIGRQTLTT